MKNVQKSVRLEQNIFEAIDEYRGDGFNEKLQNLVLDYLKKKDELTQDWKMLQAHIGDKRDEMRRIQIGRAHV